MNPFDLRGPEFLFFIAVASAVGLLFSLLLSALTIERKDAAEAEERHALHPYLLAYLRGGSRGAASAAVAALVAQRRLRRTSSGRRLVLRRRERARRELAAKPPRKRDAAQRSRPDLRAHPLEEALLDHVAAGGDEGRELDGRALDALRPELATLDAELVKRAFLKKPRRRSLVPNLRRAVPLVLMLLVIVKMVVGWSRGRPVGYLALVFGGLASWLMAAFLFRVEQARTPRGTMTLHALEARHQALRTTAESAPSLLDPPDVRLAAALFGPTVLQGAKPLVFGAGWPAGAGFWAGGGGSAGYSGTFGCGASCGGGCGGGCGGCGGCGG